MFCLDNCKEKYSRKELEEMNDYLLSLLREERKLTARMLCSDFPKIHDKSYAPKNIKNNNGYEDAWYYPGFDNLAITWEIIHKPTDEFSYIVKEIIKKLKKIS